MAQLRPRLLRTYSGLRGRGGRAGSKTGLRLLPRAAPWISPPADPKRLFSSSSSCSSPASFNDDDNDPDFRPPAKARPPPAKKVGGKKKKKQQRGPSKENKPPRKSNQNSSSFVPPTPLRRNVTYRRPRRDPSLGPPRRLGAPLLCSTPEWPLLTPLEAKRRRNPQEEGKEKDPHCPVSHPLWEVIREDSPESNHGVLLELSMLKMDSEGQDKGDSLQLFSPEEASPHPQKSLQDGSLMDPARPQCFRDMADFPIQSTLHCETSQRGVEASQVMREQSPDRGSDQGYAPLMEASPAARSPVCGVFKLRAKMQGGKIALSPQKETVFLAPERELSLAQDVSTPEEMAGEVGKLSEGASDLSIVPNSTQFQPIVVLDDQVVLNWLADRSTGKQKASCSLKKKKLFLAQSPHILRKPPNSKNNHQVAPNCNPGGTGRKACISGFSSKRWGRQKANQTAHRQNTGWKHQADSLLQERMKWNEIEDQLSVSFLPLDSSLKNSSLWRRIRASFSLHKKKKILSETDSLNGSATCYYSFQSPLHKACNTPFTQKLGYSICPSSSMVLLSSMTSLSTSEVSLTDAEKVYRECQQEGPVSFEEWISQEKMPKCEKIGEGVFGEVFKTESERGTVALKIIPIEGSEQVNGEPQKTFSEILPEIIISKELSLLADEVVNRTSGFIRLYSVHCVQGTYPEHLLNAWDEYHRLRQSENNRPDFFSDQQLFMILEFEFGGTDLENMRNRQLNSVASAKSILHQVTASLAVAEEALRFEHRDLHWGNVLVRKTSLKEVAVTLNGKVHVLPTQGILVNIIDYTFSRLERDGLTVFCDLSTDEEVFQGRGDLQFDIYRQIREENANNWADYFPHSNILWLHYLADKLLKEVSYKKKASSSSMKHVQKQLRMFSTNVLNFKSATELLNLGTFFQ
ncbi:serine/threonine-protein kinase haspin [Erythrolamprus reginae]|uniref:serine/threonine-protein kinase haspin n=1 Tax=Erythrolamprus reginae TaxID=121349 RepID=UPI00396C5067